MYASQRKVYQALVESPQMSPVTLRPLNLLLFGPVKPLPSRNVMNNLTEDVEMLLEMIRGNVEIPSKGRGLESENTSRSNISMRSNLLGTSKVAKSSKPARTKVKSTSLSVPKPTQKIPQ